MADYSLYTQSGGQLTKIPNQSNRKKFATLDEAVLFATYFLTTPRWNKKTVLQMNPDYQILVLEYSGQYNCKIVAIVGRESVKNIEVNPPEKVEEKPEEISQELSRENVERFREKYCRVCGTQLCTGGGEWLGSCKDFRKIFGEISVEKLREIL